MHVSGTVIRFAPACLVALLLATSAQATDVSDPHQFLLTGYWGEQIVTPDVLSWQEIEPQ